MKPVQTLTRSRRPSPPPVRALRRLRADRGPPGGRAPDWRPGVHMWPSWTSDRKRRTPPLRVPAAGRTAARRNGATHSDGGSTAPPPGPEPGRGPGPDRDRTLAVVLVRRF